MEQQEIREILQRAEEIEFQRSVSIETITEEKQIVAAAIEAGLSREAITQAIQERISIDSKPLELNDFVFCKSSDGNYYVAKVNSVEGTSVDVTFLKGSPYRASASEIKPLSLFPGQTVCAQWPGWGWANGRVVRYDRELRTVHLQDWMGTEVSSSLDGIRIVPENNAALARYKSLGYIVAGSIAGGGIVGALITWLILR